MSHLKYLVAARVLFVAFITVVSGGGGCMVGPDYHRPDAGELLPSEFKNEPPWKTANPSDQADRGPWWQAFDEPKLDALMRQAATNNVQVRVAFRRLEQARSLADVGSASLLPSVSFEGTASRNRRSASNPNDFRSGATISNLRFPFLLSYEIDLWGKLRRALESVRADAEAADADLAAVQLSIQAELGANYFDLRSIDEEIAHLREAVTLRETSRDLLQRRLDAGDIDALDVRRAETELATARTEVAGLQRRRALLENAIAVLAGVPSSDFTVDPARLSTAPPRIPMEVPARLLERRPDVAAAERRMAAENARIGVAQAARFPDVRLNASAGLESNQAAELLKWSSRTWGVSPSVSLPIFEGGRIRAEMNRSQERYFEAVESYRATILNAVREVDDSLVNLHWLGIQSEEQEHTLTAARDTVELSQKRYDAGLVAYFEVVDAERTHLENERLASQIQAARFIATLRLVKALGGGWEPEYSDGRAAD